MTSPKLAIVYYSGSGAISQCSELIEQGATTAGAVVTCIDVSTMTEQSWSDLHTADAIAFGTPTYMGGPAAGFKAFMDNTGDTIWTDRMWHNKIAAGFTAGVNTGGDKLSTLMALNVFAMQHGMIWVGQEIIGAPVMPDNNGLNISGTFLGLAVNTSTKGMPKGCEASARLFGQRLGATAARWRGMIVPP